MSVIYLYVLYVLNIRFPFVFIFTGQFEVDGHSFKYIINFNKTDVMV